MGSVMEESRVDSKASNAVAASGPGSRGVRDYEGMTVVGVKGACTMTLSCGVVVAGALSWMRPMEISGVRRRSVALMAQPESLERKFGGGGDEGAGSLWESCKPLYASWTACCGDDEIRAQVLVISRWVLLATMRSL
jgi:hypothetical protein